MKNRIVAIVTLGSFLMFCWSCYSIQEIRPAVLATAKAGKYEIRKIEKKTGETIEYPDKSPAKVGQGQITGTGMLTIALKTVEVDSAGLEITSKPGAVLMEVKTRDGLTYGGVKEIEERGDKSVLHLLKAGGRELNSHPIFFSEIHKVWAEKIDEGKILLLVLISVAVWAGLVYLAMIGFVSAMNSYTGWTLRVR
jgi:hypothetical protein